ncbi:hypothetical protein CDG81_01290 [Actinopolyspora erythraea]|uniref:Uncharacterized protein n=1 Tax=Actinopolyspora erythraea TaxID=414996 RepID=A0A099DBJ6_9ACTN|nr:hypothetical protein [Actinopolyspora erythraea]ASU77176.1 hypothetical protein CDG81_01290 [Actinopolyspora erythraea]KGI83132.1 hypothetical protein IL38_00385 [Actinopolyspora erythraea]
MTDRDTSLLCHELLLRLAGRIPDESLWRYRDWLAGAAGEVMAVSLPKQLVRERIGLTDADHRLLSEALLPMGADPAAVGAILPEDGSPQRRHAFTAAAPGDDKGDSEALVLGATLRGRPGVGEVRDSWRRDTTAADSAPQSRVILVSTSGDPVELTGEIQRILRALGNHTPLVEVLPTEIEPPDYHGRAQLASNLICTGSGELTGSH